MKNVKWIGAVVLMPVFLALIGCSEPEGNAFIGRWEIDPTIVKDNPYYMVRTIEIERDGNDFKITLDQRRNIDQTDQAYLSQPNWRLVSGKAILQSVPRGPSIDGKRLLVTNYGRDLGDAAIQFLLINADGRLSDDSINKFVKKP